MIVTRFPPSPTGYLHIGGARTALYSWLHARQNHGRFVLRIEDTDIERSTPESVQAIFDGMQWLGLDYDDGPYYQTQRLQRYQEVIQQLLDSGHAYHCKCSKQRLEEVREQQRAQGLKPKYDGHCRNLGLTENETTVVRFKNPLEGEVAIEDMVKGNIRISNTQLDDLIIARADNIPTYNLTVVVDDMDMGITDVIRGDDHINNTPRQINILTALGAPLPRYGHVSMILDGSGARMSKRHGAVGVMQYKEQGFLPEALLNYLVRLGWSYGDQEIFSMQELLQKFDIHKVNKSAAAFDADKLLWVNQQYIAQLEPKVLLAKARWYFEQAQIDVPEEARSYAIIGLVQERCKTLLELVQQSAWFFSEVQAYDEAAVKKWIKPNTPDILFALIENLSVVREWKAEYINAQIQAVVSQFDVGFAKVAQPIRIAISGATTSPSIDVSLDVLGQERTLNRLRQAHLHFKGAAKS